MNSGLNNDEFRGKYPPLNHPSNPDSLEKSKKRPRKFIRNALFDIPLMSALPILAKQNFPESFFFHEKEIIENDRNERKSTQPRKQKRNKEKNKKKGK